MSIGRLITLSGVDCSGKTTQLELLTDACSSVGWRVKQVWFRPGYSDEMDTLRSIIRKASPNVMPRHTEVKAREQVFAKSGVSESWLVMALVDCFIQCACKIRFYMLQGFTVICDRFLEDAELDLFFRFPNLENIYGPSLRALRSLAPTPNHALLLNLPYELLDARIKEKDEPFPDPDDVRFLRWQEYQRLSTTGRFEPIDASPSITEVHSIIRTCIGL